MAEDSPRTLTKRLFTGSLLVLGAVIALKLALDLLATFWGWLLLFGTLVVLIWAGVVFYRYWRERRW